MDDKDKDDDEKEDGDKVVLIQSKGDVQRIKSKSFDPSLLWPTCHVWATLPIIHIFSHSWPPPSFWWLIQWSICTCFRHLMNPHFSAFSWWWIPIAKLPIDNNVVSHHHWLPPEKAWFKTGHRIWKASGLSEWYVSIEGRWGQLSEPRSRIDNISVFGQPPANSISCALNTEFENIFKSQCCQNQISKVGVFHWIVGQGMLCAEITFW